MSRAAASGLAALALALALPAGADDAAPLLLNPFGDPFVQATAGRDCPAPRGPAISREGLREEAHGRAERGTSCWLAGRCAEPNAYRYDAGIAEAVVAALRADPSLASSALWVTVERRLVTLQGCVADAAQAARAEALAGAAREVDGVLPALALPGEAPRWPLAGR